jgi:UDP-GlcNAc3NAcA epimerase
MSQITVLTVVGNRPQYIKAAVLSPPLRRVAREVLLDTGQHYDRELAGVFFDQLSLPEPDIALGVGSGTHAEQTSAMLVGVEGTLLEVKPDLVLVYGDTNSTLAGALASAKLGVPVAHVEAGLRSFDRAMPEEVNRIAADHLSALLFCPTATAVDNLRAEGISAGVHLVGDVMFDLALRTLRKDREAAVLSRHGLAPKAYIYATLHRPSNVDSRENLASLLGALAAAGEPVVLPAHPRTAASIERFGLTALASQWPPNAALAGLDSSLAPGTHLGGGLHVVPPLGYLESLSLAKNARVVATDSGGLQKEAYFFSVPCVTLRTTSEWVETLQVGWNVLVGPHGDALTRALADPPRGATHPAFYGRGDAGERIAAIVAAFAAA